MFRLILVVLYVFLSLVTYYLPNQVTNDSKIFIFAIICINLLKEFDWLILKNSCKNNYSKICKIFKKKSNDKVLLAKNKNYKEIEEFKANETISGNKV